MEDAVLVTSRWLDFFCELSVGAMLVDKLRRAGVGVLVYLVFWCCSQIYAPKIRFWAVSWLLAGAPWIFILVCLLLTWTQIAHGPLRFVDFFGGQGTAAEFHF